MAETKPKVLVAMSGGVDSSVAAALLKQQGYDVTGAFICLGHAARADADGSGCCSPQDAADARRVAQQLDIPMFVLNLADAFGPIIDDFVDQYRRGRTPNPCLHCNARIKFGRLMDRAGELGMDYLATGHYARIALRSAGVSPSHDFRFAHPLAVASNEADVPSATNEVAAWEGHHPKNVSIARGLAREKDQSYALFGIERARLGRVLLPIGELAGKAQVRQLAREFGLEVHDKPDSQEICFVPDDDYAEILRARAPEALTPGDIVNSAGEVLGRHEGYARYTIGQRKGLRVAAGVPMYVTRIDPATATVTIGPKDEVLGRRLSAVGANWHADVAGAFDAIVQIRYNHAGSPARVTITGPETFDVEFAARIAAITPGQAAVIYHDDCILGGGWIV